MVLSGLQKEILALYRRGVRNVTTKPMAAQPNFLLHLRHSFRHPPLGKRDYGAIEYKIRAFTRTLETIEASDVRSISVTQGMIDWWDEEVEQSLRRSVEDQADEAEKG